jgi:uncharacterized protein (DUF1501 family)
MAYYNRRRFLQTSAAGFLGATAALAGLGQRQAFAANTGGYKAMVGVFLKGGADMFDAVMPRDQASYDQFAQVRPGLLNRYNDGSRTRESLLALEPGNAANFGGRQFGLAPELATVKSLFDSGEAAIVGAVGPLLEHVDRTQFSSGVASLPKRLFSHNDQQSTWMALATEGARNGWGGGFMRQMSRSAAPNQPDFSLITAGSNDVFLAGADAKAFKAPFNPSQSDIRLYRNRALTRGDYGAQAIEFMDRHLRDTGGDAANLFAQDVAQGQASGIENMVLFREAFANQGALSTVFPNTSLGRQLSTVARSIQARGVIGNNRQIFYADTGGFDTHNNQANSMPGRLSEVFDAITAFRDAMIELGVWNDVALFTMSDFGRTLSDNGDGTDHGWGSHQFVFGGQVQGGNIYGEMPETDPDSDRFTSSRARLIPSVSVDQYAATLGGWFGLDGGEIDRVLPNLNRFNTRNLGFMAGVSV